MSKKLLLCTAIGATMAGLSPLSAIGQALEEVLVTAQTTEESIQDVPIAIQALDASVLEKNAITSMSDIKALVPSLKVINNPTTQENLLIQIRGIPSGAIELTQDNPTAVHINGVYIARGNGLNMAVADLERIEVLKGPQGTLYGRNATAGAVNMVTARPTGEFGFKQQFTAAEYGHRLSKTSVDFPIIENLAGKVSYLYDTRDGFVDNIAPNSINFGDRRAQAARVDLMWTPTSDFTVLYGFDWSRSDYYSTPGQCIEVGVGLPMDPNECSRSFKDKLAFYGDHPENDVESFGHTLNVEWEINEALTVRSITAYREFEDRYFGILFGGGANLTGGVVDVVTPGFSVPAQANLTKGDQLSQEFQLLGDIGDTISYSTGLYFFKETGSETKGRSAQLVLRSPTSITASLNGPRDVTAENDSWAAFGQLTWTPEFADGDLDIIPGIRYTEDSRKASMFEMRGGSITYVVPTGGVVRSNSGITYTGTPNPADPFSGTGTPAQYDEDFSEVSPSLTVQYRPMEDVMVYGKVAKGYKSGGTSIRSSSNSAFVDGFDPETLLSYEAGVKSTLWDRRLRLNAAVFQSEFEDQQVTIRDTSVPITSAPQYDVRNAGESTYRGIELEAMLAITDNLRLGLNYAWLDFEYDKVKDPLTGVDITDFYHLRVPKNAWSTTLDYSLPVGFASLDFNLSYSYVDDVTGPYQDTYVVVGGQASMVAPANEKQYLTPDYGVWNGRVALTDIKVGPGDRGALTVALWGKNLADKEYASYGFATVPAAAQYQWFWGEPRTFGLDVIYNY